MSHKIRVTWQNPTFLEQTYNKGQKGLGDDYIIDPNYPYEIVFNVSDLEKLLTEFNHIISLYSSFNGNDISNYFEERGESLSGAMVRQLKRELNRILFNNTLTNVYSYFPFSDKFATSKSKTNVMKYILDILGKYKDITQRILNRQEGLAEYLDADTTERVPNLVEVPESKTQVTIGVTLVITKLQVPLLESLIDAVNNSIFTKASTFFDENREYKTLLNFGNDRQYIAESWRFAPKDSESIQLKLTRPLNTDISVDTTAFISRELAESVIDVISFELAPLADNTPYLRPFNMDARNYVDSKMFATNTTLTTLGLATASSGAVVDGTTISYGDTVFRRWFTGDFKASELNIEFTDYNNFVHFGSAYKRLQAFTQKLEKIEQLTSASISSSVSSSTISLLLKAKEKEEIIRTFDPYEQFLYYATASVPYSASAFYKTDGIEYNATGSWPKQANGTVHSPYSSIASNWLTSQLAIAQRYDDNNPNYLILNLPKHIQEDAESEDFLTLFNMVGHLMDNIKVYIDQFPNIYSTNIDPLKDLSMDQVYEVAQSFGLKLPNVYALDSLQTFNAQFSGETGSRAYVAETWKRFLHSMVYLAKTKGSRTSFDALLNTYGINSPIIQVKETVHPTVGNYIQSDELTYGLQFTGSVINNIKVPFVSSSITASTLQISFNPNKRQTSSLITGDTWAIDLVPHPSSSKVEYGRIHVVSGSGRTIIATSSYFPLFSDDYTNLMLRSQSGDISIIQTDGDQILFQQSASVNLASLWNGTRFVYVGGTGSIKLSTNFDGIVDEIRVWGENISNEDFVAQAYDPGSYYGATYTSSYTSLYVHVPFSQPLSSITQSVSNESPYQNVSIVRTLSAQGFTTASFTRVLRTVKQYTPIVGSTIYTNKKITVAEPPTFNKQFVDENGTKILNRKISIKRIDEKQYNSGQNLISFAVSPTDFINQDIMRSMGVVDVNNLIGSPRYITGSGYSTLQSIEKDYKEYFGKTVRPNDYIRFFKDLTQGPSEMADEMVPARAKLLEGIVIESSVLSRNRDAVLRKFAADGTATKEFVAYTSGSSSIGIGAYDFSQTVESISTVPDSFGYILPLDAAIAISSSVEFKESINPSKLPSFQRAVQRVGQYYVTASFQNQNSAYITLEATPIISQVSASTVSSGYARNAYLGIPASASIASRLPSEQNTLTPFYDIRPRSNLDDVGTTTYFHKSTGVYSYDIYTKYKTNYLVKLDTNTESPLDRLYAPITLLTSSAIINAPGRYTNTIPLATYSSGSKINTGLIKAANIFALYGIEAATGLRVRLYRNTADLQADINRTFAVSPGIDSGVLFDAIIQGSSDVFPYTLIQTADSNIYYNIENTTTTAIQSEIKLQYFAYEPANLLPTGYLPRHYKFSRENVTALKRRNYIGCRDTSTTFDQTAPIVITLSNANTVIVNSTTTAAPAGTGTVDIPTEVNAIKFGGGGRLGVE